MVGGTTVAVQSPRLSLLDQFDLGLLTGDARLCASIYATDAVIVPPDKQIICGRDAIRDYWWRIIDEECRAHTLSTKEFEVREDRIMERGHYAHFEHPVSLDRYTAYGDY